MGNPITSQIHINKPLTNLSIQYSQDIANNFVNSKVFPVVPVVKSSDRYYVYDMATMFSTNAQRRLPNTETAGTGYRLSNDTYSCDVFGVHDDVSDQDRANADAPLNPDQDSTEVVTQDLLLKQELDWLGKYFTTSVWTGSSTGTDVTPGTLWSAGGTPIKNMRTEIKSVKNKCGKPANLVVLSEDVWDVLIDHADLTARIKNSDDKIPTLDLLARILEVERVLIAGGVKNTAKEGQTATLSAVASKDVLIVYAAPRPGLKQPSAGYTFQWNGLIGAATNGIRIKKYRMEHLAADRIEGEMAYDHKVVNATMGSFMNNVIA